MERNHNPIFAGRSRSLESTAEPGALGRLWYVVTAAAALIGIAMTVTASVQGGAGFSDRLGLESAFARAAHIFFFWTTQSNLIVAVTFLLLAVAPRRTSTVFWTFHLLGLTAIIITGVVSNTILPRMAPLFTGALGIGLDLVHIVVPIMTVLGWLLFGPGGHYSSRLIPLASLFLPLYGIVTLVRGAMIGFYPYPFLDVTALGYGRVFGNMVGLLVVFVALAAALVWLDGVRFRHTTEVVR